MRPGKSTSEKCALRWIIGGGPQVLAHGVLPADSSLWSGKNSKACTATDAKEACFGKGFSIHAGPCGSRACVPSPQIAPGICLEVIAELLAVEPGSVLATVVITHKAHTIHVPITAEVVELL